MVINQRSSLPIPFTFSQSSLQDYRDCERRFYLRYIEQLAWPAVDSEPVLENERRKAAGEIFHRLVQQYWLGLPSEKLARMAESSNLSDWWEHFEHYDFGLSGYKTYPELNLTMQVGKHRLTAKYDLVAVGQNKVYIYDWKTNQKLPRHEWMSTHYQTRVYRNLLSRAGGFLLDGKETIDPEMIEMVYWLVNFPDQPIHLPYSTSQAERDSQQLAQLISQIETEDQFPLTPDEKKCNYCSYRSYCDRGISAASLDDENMSGMDMPTLDLDQVSEIEF